LTDAQYQQAYSYDTLDHLTSGPLGAYAYGDSTHLHAVTAIGSNYAAIYDAAGNMECRAPYYPLHCSGQPTGNLLSYDDEGRLTAWRNTLIRPTSTTTNLYDGAGRRVEQQITSLGGNSSITYVGGIEEIAASGLGTITTTYYSAGGHSIAEGVNGTIAFLASDGLGSATVALNGSGNATASGLLRPLIRRLLRDLSAPIDNPWTSIPQASNILLPISVRASRLPRAACCHPHQLTTPCPDLSGQAPSHLPNCGHDFAAVYPPTLLNLERMIYTSSAALDPSTRSDQLPSTTNPRARKAHAPCIASPMVPPNAMPQLALTLARHACTIRLSLKPTEKNCGTLWHARQLPTSQVADRQVPG
ncbi:MAG TPA: hypothetical protein VGN32_02860, partial [Ktedonobacterales bacterium]|nr:hypothetical protein [Ktedonobacterales bacterium]